MSFIKDHLNKSEILTKGERNLITEMFNNAGINENEYELMDLFDKMIEKKFTLVEKS